MKYIPLSQGKRAIVDDDDFEYLSQWKWHFASGYAVSTTIKKGSTYMHQIVNCTPKGLETDHKNGDKLDNRKENLRTATKSQNVHNMGGRKNSTSRYKGVNWDKDRKKWLVRIANDKKQKNLGRYRSEEEAALAYNKVAIEYFGEFARLNEIYT